MAYFLRQNAVMLNCSPATAGVHSQIKRHMAWLCFPALVREQRRFSSSCQTLLKSAPLALVLTACAAPSVPARKIVSDNPCVDGILADVAKPEQIGAISAYSHDPRATSVPLPWAARFPAIGGTAEEIIAAKPTLYITGSPANPATQAAVARAGIPMLAISVPNSVAQSAAQIRDVARAIGRVSAGEALVARVESATKPVPPSRISALIYQGGGLILGEGTLADDLLTRAGFSNAARNYSRKPWDVQPLERIIMQPPDIILSPRSGPGEEARGLAHLRSALHGKVRVADFNPKLLYCGAGSIIRASARLREIRRS